MGCVSRPANGKPRRDHQQQELSLTVAGVEELVMCGHGVK